ncbi:MAG: hypothetical protein WKG00_03670 [Polyangiaceae bacterium]
MPLIPGLDFASRALRVSYCASTAPQEVVIDVTVAAAPVAPFAGWSMQAVCAAINLGAAGGAVFSPAAGAVERLSGPWSELEGAGASYSWVLRVASVDPLFIRNMVEELRRSGFDRQVTWMSIQGSLPLDGTSMSVREGEVRAWLDDPNAYPGTWPALPFAVRQGDRGASGLVGHLRVGAAAAIDVATRTRLEELSVHWLNCLRNVPSVYGGLVDFDPNRMLPHFAQGKTEFRARFPELPYLPAPSRAALTNMLARFHETVLPLTEVELPL